MRGIYAAAIGLLVFSPIVSIAQTTNTYSYDDLGRLKSVTYPSGVKTGYNYDKADNRTLAKTALNGVLNSPPGCGTSTINITGVPAYVPTISVTASFSAIPCSDPDGDALTVTSPASPPTFTLAQGQSYSIPLTVSDGNGGIAYGTLIYHRQ